MKKFLVLALVLPLAGCYTPEERAVGGAAVGGLGGAAIGSLASGGRAGPTLAGAALGAATGAVVGATTAPPPPPPPPRCARWGSDYYGQPTCLGYY